MFSVIRQAFREDLHKNLMDSAERTIKQKINFGPLLNICAKLRRERTMI